MSADYENLPVGLRYKDDFYELFVTVDGYDLTFGGGNKPELVSRIQEAQAAKTAEASSGEPTTPA